ncbi:hypothetical protein [Hymenobacter crusticola]|uniref:Uncharacterized protein n=1 Tax=Hymenobacter crusticola TaxID=1770526 RepID=A0A243W8S8_9BACT|nr:hypothetical protein [Hymenobacter crusticola]OUJ71770.1 hypothetical protein BXP70_20650 [Hymenobacter crusticola]
MRQNLPELLLYACGVYNLLFVVFHALFWRLFKWHKQLRKLKTYNRAIVQILNLRLIYVLGVFGALCLAYPAELLSASLGHFILGSMAVFWLGRLIEQFVFLPINTRPVYSLALIFFLGTLLHAFPLLLSLLHAS